MNELRDIVVLVLGIFAVVSGLLYVLTAIEPRTDQTGRPHGSRTPTHTGSGA